MSDAVSPNPPSAPTANTPAKQTPFDEDEFLDGVMLEIIGFRLAMDNAKKIRDEQKD